MLRDRASLDQISDFMKYLASSSNAESDRLPPLTDLSQELGISVASLREQLEVARTFGLVEVRPKTGIRRLPYTFAPAVVVSSSSSTGLVRSSVRTDPESAHCGRRRRIASVTRALRRPAHKRPGGGSTTPFISSEGGGHEKI